MFNLKFGSGAKSITSLGFHFQSFLKSIQEPASSALHSKLHFSVTLREVRFALPASVTEPTSPFHDEIFSFGGCFGFFDGSVSKSYFGTALAHRMNYSFPIYVFQNYVGTHWA
jgi:hypothetical protein